MFDHGERVTLADGTVGRVLYPVSTTPVEFFDPLEGPFVLRGVRVLLETGEVRMYLASSLTPVAEPDGTRRAAPEADPWDA